MPLAAKIRRVDDILSAPLDETLLMMSIAQGQYYEASGAGRRIWDLLAAPMSEPEIVETLVSEFDVPRDVCAAEVRTFVDDLKTHGLVVETEASGS